MIKDWRDSETARTLKLSLKQIEAIEQAFLAYRLRLVNLRAEVVKIILQPSAWASPTEADAPPDPSDPLVALGVTVEQEQARMVAVLQGILTTEQWCTLRRLQPQRAPRSLVTVEAPEEPATAPRPRE